MGTTAGKMVLTLGMALSLGLSTRASADAGVDSDTPKIEVFCNLSTRVVAMTIRLGINPIEGLLTHSVSKYHAFEPAQNFQFEGGNRSGISQGVSMSKNFGMLVINATGLRSIGPATRHAMGDYALKALLRKGHGNSYKLQGLVIDGRDYLIGLEGTVHCDISH